MLREFYINIQEYFDNIPFSKLLKFMMNNDSLSSLSGSVIPTSERGTDSGSWQPNYCSRTGCSDPIAVKYIISAVGGIKKMGIGSGTRTKWTVSTRPIEFAVGLGL